MTRRRGKIKDRAAAFEACRELIYGDGTSDSVQRSIDLARIALGLERSDYQTVPRTEYRDAVTGANPRATAKLIDGLRRSQ